MSGYAYVFTGTVKSAVQLNDTDKTVEFIPHEIFLGNSSGPITVRATEACLDDEIRVGDRWLVYAYKTPQDNSLILSYNSPSKPLEKTERSVILLRRLGALQNSGIVTGRVLREIWTEGHWTFLPVEGRTVVAKRADGIEFTGVTDAEGYYQFEVPPDSYRLSANTERTLWAPEERATIQNKSCRDVNFLLHNDPRYSDEKKK